jgi:hypothetical protein
MPTISPHRDIDRCFATARRLTTAAQGGRRVIIIAPDGSLVQVPAR